MGKRKFPLNDKNGKSIYVDSVLGLDNDPSKCQVIFHEGVFKRSYLPFLKKEDKEDDDFYEKDYIHPLTKDDLEMWYVIE